MNRNQKNIALAGAMVAAGMMPAAPTAQPKPRRKRVTTKVGPPEALPVTTRAERRYAEKRRRDAITLAAMQAANRRSVRR